MTKMRNLSLRPACLSGLLRYCCAAVLTSGLLALPANAAMITNTAHVLYDWAGGTASQPSNATALSSLPAPTPSTTTFYQYAPGVAGATTLNFDGGAYDTGGGNFSPLGSPTALDGSSIDLAIPVPVQATTVYHAGEPVFIVLQDGNRNTDPSVRETIEVTVVSSTGDSETLKLEETGPNTGIFAAVIPTAGPGQTVTADNGVLSLGVNSTLTVNYQDIYYPSDTSHSNAFVDPYGVVFDSATGKPVSGAVITLIDTATGMPAVVYGDNGDPGNSFPATITSGGSATDSAGNSYSFPAGSFRFPFVKPGSYRYQVTPPAGYVAPSQVPAAQQPLSPAGTPYSVVAGSYMDNFAVVPGPALHIDIPVDPRLKGLVLQKSVSQPTASAGDFLQYQLSLQNLDAVNVAKAVSLTDRLPIGMRYQSGSLRLNGAVLPDPAIDSDGRTLHFSIGDLAAAATAQIHYVVTLGAGVIPGQAVNSAQATSGSVTSNVAQVAVTIQAPFFSGAATLIGRVFEGDCNTPWSQLKGVPNVRVMMEDGSYAVTDKDGQYHFEGVTPGTHVVQVDTDSLPADHEMQSCVDNTRFGGRAYSQFVDVQGGSLWRADFFTRVKAPQAAAPAPAPTAEIGLSLGSRLDSQADTRTISGPARSFTVQAHFASCKADLPQRDLAELAPLIKELRGQAIQRIDLVGHTDNQHLSARCKAQFGDNKRLSLARAKAVGEVLARELGLSSDQIQVEGHGEDEPVTSNATAAGMARNRRTEVVAHLKATLSTIFTDTSSVTGLRHTITVDGSTPVKSLAATVMLEHGAHYKPGSATLDGSSVADPELDGGMATFRLGGDSAASWRHVLEFVMLPGAPAGQSATVLKSLDLDLHYEPCSSAARGTALRAVGELATALRGKSIDHVELTATGDQKLPPRCKARFPDGGALAQARTEQLRQLLAQRLGLKPAVIKVQASGGAAARVVVYGKDGGSGPASCDSAFEIKAMARVETMDGQHAQTPVASNRLGCGAATPDAAKAGAAAGAAATGTGLVPVSTAAPSTGAASGSETESSERQTVKVAASATTTDSTAAPAAPAAIVSGRAAIVDDITAAGGKTDWLEGQAPGVEWLFPGLGHNPRSPAVRIVIKHLPGQSIVLRQPDGEPVSALAFDGETKSVDGSVVISVWRGVPVKEGDNEFTAEIHDRSGALVSTLKRDVVFAGVPASAELVAAQSVLVGDGVTRPVIAIRLLDRNGHPVRAGITGPIRIGAPFRPWEEVQNQQDRQLAGMDRATPHYRVEGDDGIAYVELAPTNDSGAVRLGLDFQTGPATTRHQDLQAWMQPAARKWVMVGFAQGTVGYNTLQDHMQALPQQGVQDGAYSNDQISLYAKGQVLGKWLLTMAYNTAKHTGATAAAPGSVLSPIDPSKYYTLYGDGTSTRYDATSQSKLYLKLEQGQFYALFGDYDTGLTQTQLSRYSRTLNGIKVENGGGPVTFIMFAAETPQNYARDEIQGNGTSGLYLLSHRGIVLNSERIRIETRDRLHSENILQTQQLTAHVDYEIDYDNGTIYFKQPVYSRDTNFNPIFIVAEYETVSTSSQSLDAGGRVAVALGKNVVAGVSAIHDEGDTSHTGLGGADLKVKVGTDSELRVEAAQTGGKVGLASSSGDAWLAEYEHHDGKLDALLYARRQGNGFGMDQQNAAESGQQKTGVDSQYHLDKHWAVQTQVYEQSNLANADRRDAAVGKLQYSNDKGGASVGLQVVNDSAPAGTTQAGDYRSEQATLAANRWYMDHKLEVNGEVDSGLGTAANSIDFPNRYLVGAGYSITKNARLVAAQEITDGSSMNTSTTRAGVEVTPWKGAHLDSTLNQTEMSEYGPRTFGNFGLTQGLVLNKNWGVDFGYDGSYTLARASQTAPAINSNEPVAIAGTQSSPTLTDDYNAYSVGATYRDALWSWNGRAELRDGQASERKGLSSNFLRQATAGVAFGSAARAFRDKEAATGTDALTMSADAALAWRPLGVQWSVLDRLEFRYNAIANGTGVAGNGAFGFNSLTVAGNATTRHLINNFALNHVSREWTEADREGNLFTRYERSQWSLYYGAKYASDNFDGSSYSGYTDLLGLEARYDINRRVDIGVQASSLNGWSTGTHRYSFGPAIGFSPVSNGWITFGYNFRGFRDQDFDAARYTAQGIYLQLRLKFDQNTRVGSGKNSFALSDLTPDTTNRRDAE